MHTRKTLVIERLLRPVEGFRCERGRVGTGQAAEAARMHHDPFPTHGVHQPRTVEDIPHGVVPFGRILRRERNIIGRVQRDGDSVRFRLGAELGRRFQLHPDTVSALIFKCRQSPGRKPGRRLHGGGMALGFKRGAAPGRAEQRCIHI